MGLKVIYCFVAAGTAMWVFRYLSNLVAAVMKADLISENEGLELELEQKEIDSPCQ